MTPEALLAELNQLNVKVSLAGDKLHVEAPAGVVTPELKDTLRQHKPELLTLLLKRTGPRNVFCFRCFKAGGKAIRYQPHTAVVCQEFPGWLELTCLKCGGKCYTRPQEKREVHKGDDKKVKGVEEAGRAGN